MSQSSKYDAPFEAQFDPDRAQEFIILRLLRNIHTATPVKVLAVHELTNRSGTVDVQPLILDQDTKGRVIPQSPAYGLPFLRVQGGRSAVKCDPVVGDIGIAVFAERDTSNVVRTFKEGAAPTDRTYSSADGWYLGGFLNAAATQYLTLDEDGIAIFTPDTLEIEAKQGATVKAPLLTVTAEVVTSANVKVGTGASGSFTTPTGQTVTVQDGIITNIY